MGLWSWFKSLTIVHLLMGYIFMASGFLVSFLMLVGVVIRPFNKTLYRKYAYFLSYALWSQFSFLAHWWVRADCKLYISPEDQKRLGKSHSVCMVNHTYEIDWLMAWMMAERHGMLGNTKIYGKDILKYVPVLGWTWYFTESIFLKRSWDEDKKILEKSITELITYPDPFWLLLFPEGTRWTPKKHAICQKIAKEKGYPEYKHMLLPRTKGFTLSMQLMKGKIPTVLDCTVGFPASEPEPTLWDAISGKKIRCAIIARTYKIDDIPCENEEECGNWLRQIYKQKDDDLEYYKQTEKFNGLPVIDVPKRYYDLCWYIFWLCLTCIPLCYYVVYLVFTASIVHKVTVIVIVTAMILVMKWMISFSEVKHGTSYGLENKQNGTKKSQ
ncbi:1-acyl-sn-glycerol-3-phosphate acyltransferase delta-like isoform X2 [Ruditapes philippinarum]|uniref:1-acyl-sn-glycerol-3-phosphate acyltransferase delta-like isoform X2 n=1 Tax=Ruditapes philippinarum TaxID=129788 RepID=UPI00295BAE10|nr:1-acyl-sn-glycerol-3-phosphate acyltransferase delta-like isoform X2 [Ruditapes philippinarum]